MVHLTYLSAIRFTGIDAVSFLHNQLTANIEKLENGACTYAALCQPKGRVIAVLLVMVDDQGLMVLCRHTLAERLVQHLRRFVFRDDVTIHLVEDGQVLGGLGKLPTEAGFVPYAPLDDLYYLVTDGSHSANLTAGLTEEHYHAQELERGVCWLGQETTEQFIPQMLGMEAINALDFRKGCIPGQEVVARLRYLGKLKRHPVVIRLNQAQGFIPMEEINLVGEDSQSEGVVVDSAKDVQGHQISLVVVRCPEPFEISEINWETRLFNVETKWLNPPPPDKADH